MQIGLYGILLAPDQVSLSCQSFCTKSLKDAWQLLRLRVTDAEMSVSDEQEILCRLGYQQQRKHTADSQQLLTATAYSSR